MQGSEFGASVVVGGLTLFFIAAVAGTAVIILGFIHPSMPSTVREFLWILFYSAAFAGAALIFIEYVHLRVLPIVRDASTHAWASP
jgi:hypothetical protein